MNCICIVAGKIWYSITESGFTLHIVAYEQWNCASNGTKKSDELNIEIVGAIFLVDTEMI